MMDITRCKERVPDSTGFHYHRCRRKAKKDGYCFQHHPDSVKKRKEEMDRRYEEKKKQSDWYRLAECLKENEKLLKVVAVGRDRLGSWMSAALDDPTACEKFKDDIRAWFKAMEEAGAYNDGEKRNE